ncbi:probable thiopurine S-methyltransferase [Liolophura sinensis]|uniref:probable thiopurine S-methyltransferase n=1 Tax=Liolophura sinensis TaxID=3198878 RepID=UPI003158F6E0
MAASNDSDVPEGMRINPYGDLEPFELGTEDWEKRWEKNNIGFHSYSVREILKRNVDRLVEGREKIKILVPLCGKSLDIKWLYDQGHTIVGIECSEMAVKAFFQEQRLEYQAEGLSKGRGKLYQNSDGKIKLYQMDLFEFTKEDEGLFDAIWDKNSFIAVNKVDRKKYCETILSLMSKDSSYLLDVFNYDPDQFTGPPHNVSRQDVDNVFGAACSVTEMESVDALTDTFKKRGLSWLTEILYLLKLKQC